MSQGQIKIQEHLFLKAQQNLKFKSKSKRMKKVKTKLPTIRKLDVEEEPKNTYLSDIIIKDLLSYVPKEEPIDLLEKMSRKEKKTNLQRVKGSTYI